MSWYIILSFLFFFAEAGQCPPGYSLSNAANKCYRVYENYAMLMEAQYICTQGGGILATIPSAAANAFVLSLIGSYSWYTIGASNLNVYYERNYSTNSIKWFDGTPFNYSNFDVDEPSFNDCVVLNKASRKSSTCDNMFPFVCSANPIYNTSAIQLNSCPSGWIFYYKTSSCYRLLFNENFDQAQLTCSYLGANLTSVTSADENNFLIGLAETGLPLGPNQQVWIGIRRQGSQWYNIDGSSYTYSNFGSLYPRVVDGDNNCAVLFADRWSTNPGFVGYWQDYSCSSTQRAYICKMPATSG